MSRVFRVLSTFNYKFCHEASTVPAAFKKLYHRVEQLFLLRLFLGYETISFPYERKRIHRTSQLHEQGNYNTIA